MEKLFKNLHAASLEMATHLLAEATDQQQRALEHALEMGAYLTVETGPMPDPEGVALIVVYPDGYRLIAVHRAIQREPLQ